MNRYKKILIAIPVFILGIALSAGHAQAATCTWTASSSLDWSDSGNWDCGFVPGLADNVEFDGDVTSTDANIDIDAEVNLIRLRDNYAGTVTQGSGISVTTTDILAILATANASGTYTGSTGNLDVGDTLGIRTGIFNAGSLNITIGNDILIGNLTPSTTAVFNANSSVITLTDDFQQYSGTFNGGTASLSASTGLFFLRHGVFTAPSTMSVESLYLNSSTGEDATFNHNNGTITVTGTASSFIQSGDASSATAINVYNLTINKSAGSLEIENNTILNVTHDLLLADGFIISGGSGATFNVYGDISSLFDWGNGDTIVMNLIGTAAQEIAFDHAEQWGSDIVINKSSGTVTLGAHFDIGSNDFTITSGAFNLDGYNFTVDGTFSNNGTVFLDGDETISAVNDTDSGSIIYNGTGTYNGLAFGNDYYNFKINGSGDWTQTADLSVDGSFFVANGSFDSDGYDVTVSGDAFTVGAASYTAGANTVTLDGGNQSLSISSATTFNNLTKIVSSASTLTVFTNSGAAEITINGAATIKGASGQLLTITGQNNDEHINFAGTVDLQYLDVTNINNTNATAVTCFNCVDSGNNTNWIFNNPSTGGSSSSGGSSTINPGMLSAPKAPASGSFAVSINGGAVSTASRNVTLTFNTGTDTTKVAVSNRSDFSGASQVAYSPSMTWDLCSGVVNCVPGTATVYVKFYTAYGVGTAAVMDSINLTALGTTTPEPTTCSYANGTLIKTNSSPAVYQIMNGYKHAIESARVFNGLGLNWNAIISVNSLSMCPTGANVMLPEQMAYAPGNLIKEPSSPKVYYVDNEGVLHWIVNEVAFEKLGFDWNAIVLVPDGSVAGHTMGVNLDALSTHPNGTLLKYFGNAKVYMIEDGKKRWITSASVFEANNLNWFAIVEVELADYPYPDGTNISGTLN